MADYGTTVSWVADMSPEGHVVSGNRVVGEALARRLMTPRGRLIAYPDYGYDLTQFVFADMSAKDFIALRAGVAAECVKDERVESVTVDSSFDGEVLTLTIDVEASQGPFTLVLAVSDVTLKVLQVSP